MEPTIKNSIKRLTSPANKSGTIREQVVPKPVKKHGIVITKHAKYQTKTIWQRGYRMVTYRYQPLELKFKNVMINDTNQDYCGGWFMRELDNSNKGLLQRVLSGQKPMAVITARDENDLLSLIPLIDTTRFDHELKPPRFLCERDDGSKIFMSDLMVSIKGKFKDLFALETLRQDYANAGILIDIDEAGERELKDYFDEWDAQDDNDVKLWETGLILGYPVENTISISRCGVC